MEAAGDLLLACYYFAFFVHLEMCWGSDEPSTNVQAISTTQSPEGTTVDSVTTYNVTTVGVQQSHAKHGQQQPCQTDADCKGVSPHHRCLKAPRDCGYLYKQGSTKKRICAVVCGGKRCGFRQICAANMTSGKSKACQCEPGTYKFDNDEGVSACFPPYALLSSLKIHWRTLPSDELETDFRVAEEKYQAIKVPEGVDVQLKCVLEYGAFPEPDISWEFSDAAAKITHKEPTVRKAEPKMAKEALNKLKSRSLIVRTKKPEVDLKSFTCTVDHPAGQTMEAKVIIYAVPSGQEALHSLKSCTNSPSANNDSKEDGQSTYSSADSTKNGFQLKHAIALSVSLGLAILIAILITTRLISNRRANRQQKEVLRRQRRESSFPLDEICKRTPTWKPLAPVDLGGVTNEADDGSWFYARVTRPDGTNAEKDQPPIYEEIVALDRQTTASFSPRPPVLPKLTNVQCPQKECL